MGGLIPFALKFITGPECVRSIFSRSLAVKWTIFEDRIARKKLCEWQFMCLLQKYQEILMQSENNGRECNWRLDKVCSQNFWPVVEW